MDRVHVLERILWPVNAFTEGWNCACWMVLCASFKDVGHLTCTQHRILFPHHWSACVRFDKRSFNVISCWCVAWLSEVLHVFQRGRGFGSVLPFTGFVTCQASSMLWWIESWVSVIMPWSMNCTSNPHTCVWAEDLSVWLNGLHWHPSDALLSSLLPPSSYQIDPLEMDADMHSLEGTNWLLDQQDSSRRPVSTKYETTIFWGRIPTADPLPSCPLSPPSTSSLHPCIQFCIHSHTYMQARCLLTVMVKHPSGLPTPAPSSDAQWSIPTTFPTVTHITVALPNRVSCLLPMWPMVEYWNRWHHSPKLM